MNNYTKKLKLGFILLFSHLWLHIMNFLRVLELQTWRFLWTRSASYFHLLNSCVLNNYHIKGKVLNIVKISLEYLWFFFICVWKILLVGKEIVIFLPTSSSHINKSGKGKCMPSETKLMLRFPVTPVTHPGFLWQSYKLGNNINFSINC